METDTKEPALKRPRTGDPTPNDVMRIPTFEMDQLSSNDFLKAYQRYQAVHLKSNSNLKRNQNCDKDAICWKDIGSIYQELEACDQESWCIENKGTNSDQDLTFQSFLAPQILANHRAYCSFLVQKDEMSYQRLVKRLPVAKLGDAVDDQWKYEPCLWIFFGRNPTQNDDDDDNPLEGRGLHTDSVRHDGTWHYQLSGTKEWYLTPSCDLVRHWKEQQSSPEWDESTKLRVSCQEGDVLVVNTRLWFHRTVIPCQPNPSVSYARDFRFEEDAKDDDKDNTNRAMTNLDGLYARNEIDAGTIIFTESDMPDCELHRSKDDPNCEVVELEDGTSAVVSKRAIACGEFFCVPESSDEEDNGDFEEEEEESESGEE